MPSRGTKRRKRRSKKETIIRVIRSRHFRRMSLSILLLFLVIGLVYVLKSEAIRSFRLRHIEVSGNRILSDKEIISALKIERGQSLIGLKSRLLRARLIKNPWIREAVVRKKLPDTLMIRIEENTPFALLRTQKGLFIIDKRGRVLEKAKGIYHFLPVIKETSSNKDFFREALRLVEVVRKNERLLDRRVIITGTKPEDLSMIIDGKIVKIGKGKYGEKLRRFFIVEEDVQQRAFPVKFFDLRYKKRVIVRLTHAIVSEERK